MDAAFTQRVQHIGHPSEGVTVHLIVRSVISLIGVQHLLVEFLMFTHTALGQLQHAVADLVFVCAFLKDRQAVFLQRPVHGRGDVRQGMHQRAVQIKNHALLHGSLLLPA